VLGKSQTEAAGLLLWFLIALPIGAVLGGWIATRIGDRAVTFVGMLIAAGGYWLIHSWREDLLDRQHSIFGLFDVPWVHTDLLVAGLGLGLVIGPLSSATLRVVPAAQHGVASAAVVVARMTGMLIGVAALSAWGFYRFNQIFAEKVAHIPPELKGISRMLAQRPLITQAFAEMYGEIFTATAVICVVGALLGLLISTRKEHAEEPEVLEEEPATDPAPTP